MTRRTTVRALAVLGAAWLTQLVGLRALAGVLHAEVELVNTALLLFGEPGEEPQLVHGGGDARLYTL